MSNIVEQNLGHDYLKEKFNLNFNFSALSSFDYKGLQVQCNIGQYFKETLNKVV